MVQAHPVAAVVGADNRESEHLAFGETLGYLSFGVIMMQAYGARAAFRRMRLGTIGVLCTLCIVVALRSGALAYEIDLENIAGVVYELSLPRYAGRLTGTDGNWAAVEYVAERFRELGLVCADGLEGYLQPYAQPVRIMHSKPELEIVDTSGSVIKRFQSVNQFAPAVSPGCRVTGEVMSPGVIIRDIDDIREIRGEAVLLVPSHFTRDPAQIEAIMGCIMESCAEGRIQSPGVILETDTLDRGYFPISSFVAPETDASPQGSGGRGGTGGDHEQAAPEPMVLICDVPTFADISDATAEGAQVRMFMDYSVEQLQTANVVGVLPGSATDSPGDCLLIAAHIDHLGSNMDGTYNPGAMDNASGVAAMLEIARVLAESPERPGKTVIFVAFNGEEQSTYGSRHYVSSPCFPLEQTSVVNIDTVGSPRGVLLQIENPAGHDTRLARDLCNNAEELGIPFRKSSSRGTDHSSFADVGVEAVNLIQPDFAGGYHGPGDTADKVDCQRIAEVVRLILAILEPAGTSCQY